MKNKIHNIKQGDIFNFLEVLEYISARKIRCKCTACDSIIFSRMSSLIHQKQKSCGCVSKRPRLNKQIDYSKILELKDKNYTHRQIAKELGIGKSTVTQFLNPNVKKKNLERTRQWDKTNRFYNKIKRFFSKSYRSQIGSCSGLVAWRNKIKCFFRGEKMKYKEEMIKIQNKFGPNPRCYLTGIELSYDRPEEFNLDHVIPKSKGGESTLDNMGILTVEANKAKDEHIEYCKKVLEYQGYKITK